MVRGQGSGATGLSARHDGEGDGEGVGYRSAEEVRRAVEAMWRHSQLLSALLHERQYLPAAAAQQTSNPAAAAPAAAAAAAELPTGGPAPNPTATAAAEGGAEAAARAEAEAVWARAGEQVGGEVQRVMAPLSRLLLALHGGGRGGTGGTRGTGGAGGAEVMRGDDELGGEGWDGREGKRDREWGGGEGEECEEEGAVGWVERVEALRVVRARGRAVRKKRWRASRRAEQAVAWQQREEQRQAVEARIDAWRARVMERDAQASMARQQQAEEEAREKRERAQLQKQVDVLMLVARLRELRRLRVLCARRHGRVVEGEEEAFMRAVREAVQQEDAWGDVHAHEEGRGGAEGYEKGRGEAEEQEEGRVGVEEEARLRACVWEQAAAEARTAVGGSGGDGGDGGDNGGMEEAGQGQGQADVCGSREGGAHHVSLHGLAAVRCQWDAFLLPLPCSAPTPHPHRSLGALVPHTSHAHQLLASTSSFSAPAAPPAAAAAAAASLPPGVQAPGSSVPPFWVPGPPPATSEWRRYLVGND
ncbi:unnamed protein product [Closterium sp. NIES-54]